MKKLIIILIVVIVLALCLFACQRMVVEHLYPATMLVLEIDRSSDTVLMATESGHAYAFYGVEDYEVDDILSVLMFDSFSPYVQDDRVITVQYSGF